MPNDHLTVDQAGRDFIARWEGLRLKPYFCSAKKPTVGVGHLIKPAEAHKYPFGVEITREEAMRLLEQDLSVAESAIRRNVRVALTQSQFNALASFVFNLGTKWISEGSVLAAVNEGRFNDVPAALLLFCNVTKDVVGEDGAMKRVRVPERGLVLRREAEGALFLSDASAPAKVEDTKSEKAKLDPRSVRSVRSVQEALVRLGYDLGASGADGIAGKKTTEAVRAFQAKSGLVVDGKMGPKTAAALQAALEALTATGA